MFDASVIAAMQAHAEAEYPRECVGVVVDGSYRPENNTHPTPETHFKIDDARLAELVLQPLQAIVHSHPDQPAHPSEADMRQQLATNVPWGIVPVVQGHAGIPFFWGTGVPVPELVGRPFRHGVTDCYSMIRDWYRLERNIVLPDYARSWEWWNTGGNLYDEYFADAGFAPIHGDPEIGDVFLSQIRSPVTNHAGIYIGEGLILHHLTDRLSRREPVYGWQKFITRWIRHQGGAQ
jgi:cell wall-associated NlpC family hydrolase